MNIMIGTVTLVQEGRFQVIDEDGVGHFFILSYRAEAEVEQLTQLQHRHARVRVTYRAVANLIGNLATAITVLD